nr:hypothetical protein B0A51_09352 [Rachicladosporium sp. CCFEE 5018]
MPTPDETILPPSPPRDLVTRSSFVSCPTDDDCGSSERNAPGDDSDLESVAAAEDAARIEEAVHAIAQQPTPEPDTMPVAVYEPTRPRPGSKAARNKVREEAVSSLALRDGAEDEQTGSRARDEASEADEIYYLSSPPDHDRLGPSTTTTYLYPGSKFQGTQQSDRQVYDVQVEIKDVDIAESFICGYLRIQGLTDDHPTLTTFFEGEIIGPKHHFRTGNPAWGSSEKVDMQHWEKFPAFRPLAEACRSPTWTLRNYAQRKHLFMRWKEYFLVPDHRVKTITGASFEGFYYICFDQSVGSVSGIYFHAKSERYQQLKLEHVGIGGGGAAMEFR